MNTDKSWWKVKLIHYQGEYNEYEEIFFKASNISSLNEWTIIVDGIEIFYGKECSISDIVKNCISLDLIYNFLHIGCPIWNYNLVSAIQWIEESFPGVICPENMNSQESLQKQIVRLLYEGGAYEYNPEKYWLLHPISQEQATELWES